MRLSPTDLPFHRNDFVVPPDSEPEPQRERSQVNSHGPAATQDRTTRKQSLDLDPRASQKPLPGTPPSSSRHRQEPTPTKAVPSPIVAAPEPAPAIEVTEPPATPAAAVEEKPAHFQNGSNGSTGSGSSKQSRLLRARGPSCRARCAGALSCKMMAPKKKGSLRRGRYTLRSYMYMS
ncbi:hypothetical protein NUW54_g10981 [Trametes sanguinea]|uniref:Uncharacterized protein n=1 Tax=Trametes sanguinea TaxID=158606 RepID=A0ACC1NMX5_9APHY|nr:hypothetical protein NUW54_g10981 [Trametes sanguinea]